jgi:transcriptional regulator with XRE-family HTH domain
MKNRTENRSLAKLRRRTGMTQHQLSDETGIAVGRIVFFETERSELLPQEIDKVRSVLRKRARQTAMDAVAR